MAVALAATGVARAEDGGGELERQAPPSSEVHARLDLSQTVAADSLLPSQVLFSDARVMADAQRLGGSSFGLHLDGRARKSWNDLADDRWSITEAYARYGTDADRWRVTAGRQLIRPVASAELDGLSVERQLSQGASAVVFGGLEPHPLTGAPNLDFAEAGAGYEARSQATNHAGGAALSLYRGSPDRFYLTQRSLLVAGPTLTLSGFAVVDLLSPSALVGGGDSRVGLDLTNLNLLARFRPVRGFDSTLTVNHFHTILPSRWWFDWLNEQRRALGYVLDGEQPVGTRVSSVRWTNTLTLSPALVPYLRLRYDRRHTDLADGYEGALGLKLRPKAGYLDFAASYRRYFGAESQLVAANAGLERTSMGMEAGATAMRTRPLDQESFSLHYEVHAFAWLEVGEALGVARGLRFMIQYQGFFEPRETYHLGVAQLGYRF